MKHHYKKILIAFFFSLQFSFLNAQWVTIPDPALYNWLLNNGYSQCLNAGQLDTTCTAVVSVVSINFGNGTISNLDGIQYFDSLIFLDCTYNQITSIPALPNLLEHFSCYNNQLTTLPSLPDSIQYIRCELNLLTSLPSLPGNLVELKTEDNQLTALPALPNSLVTLWCYNNPLSSLPTLPASLYDLDCSYTPLVSLPALPSSLGILYCYNSSIASLPSLPASLWKLLCDFTQISFLPTLPNGLLTLGCGGNQLDSLPDLPSSLNTLECTGNQLTSLPELPNSIFYLECGLNQLSALPALPDSLYSLVINDNPNLTCLPYISGIHDFDFTNTGIQCFSNNINVYNSNPPISSLPICDIFNTNGCDVFWNISGKAFEDVNTNCIADTNDFLISNLKVRLFSGGNIVQQVYTLAQGTYSFDADTGTYTYAVDTIDLPITVTCPASGFQTSVLTAADSMDYDMDFGLQCKSGFDVGVTSVAKDSGIFRAAHFARVKISAGDISNFYGLHCAAGTSGSVQVILSGAVSYVGATAGALTPVVSGDTLLYSIADFGTVNFNSDFSITMQTDTTAISGSQICFDVNVLPASGDINSGNNFLQNCFMVVGSYDPNTKEVFPEGNIDTSQHWFTYTINFQNTGTAPAQHIYILDTLDNSLDESSFSLLSYSHQPLTQVIGKVIRFNFPNINLPDSTNNEPNSHGYVQYKVKLKTGLTNGTLIHNTAEIFFDFNTPVTTNTTENEILITTGINEFNPDSYWDGLKFKVVPNPFHNSTLLKIISPMKSGNYNLEIYNVIGEKMREIKSLHKNEIVIERKNLEAGIYIFKLFDGKELKGTGKLVVQ